MFAPSSFTIAMSNIKMDATNAQEAGAAALRWLADCDQWPYGSDYDSVKEELRQLAEQCESGLPKPSWKEVAKWLNTWADSAEATDPTLCLTGDQEQDAYVLREMAGLAMDEGMRWPHRPRQDKVDGRPGRC